MEDKSREFGQQFLSLPHDVVPLPSGGRFYKNKKKSLKVGYLTASDENILLGGTDDITGSLLRNKIYEPDMRIDDLLEGDVEAILIFLRNTSFGPEMMLTLIDPQTKKSFETNVRLDELDIKQPKQEPNEDGTYNTTLPKSGANVKLKILTYGEQTELQKILDSYPQGRVPPKVTLLLQRQILEVDGNSDKGEIAKFVEQLPISDSKYIRNFLFDNEPRLDLKRVVIAPSGEKLTVNVSFGVEFFRPFF
jgi:hypothetical protein